MSGEYILMKSSAIWGRVAFVKPMRMSMRPGRTRASSSLSGQLVVMIRTLPSWEATPSMTLRRPERVRPCFPLSSSSLASLKAFAISVPTTDAGVASSLGFFLSSSVFRLLRPAVSMSSRRTTQRFGRLVNKELRSSSVRVGSAREAQ